MSPEGSAALRSGQHAPATNLAEPFEPKPATVDQNQTRGAGKKQKKRGFFGFGRKNTEGAKEIQQPATKAEPSTTTTTAAPIAGAGTASRMAIPTPGLADRRPTGSPIRSEFAHTMAPSSPIRHFSSSPRLSSPAGSQIFERDVQESNALIPNSPAIPSHIQTENHIPPVLDASSEAITDSHLDPDAVEIVTHASHQPAAVTVTGVPLSPPTNDTVSSWADDLAVYCDHDATDSASNFGSIDATDIRRLSFISFADVVQSEHPGSVAADPGSSIHVAGLTSLPSMSLAGNQSPSPIRSPVSSAGGGGTSPPTSKSGSVKGFDLSPVRKPLGSPAAVAMAGSAHLSVVSGDLSIETMSQALRRSGSRDLSSFKSVPGSPIEGPSR